MCPCMFLHFYYWNVHIVSFLHQYIIQFHKDIFALNIDNYIKAGVSLSKTMLCSSTSHISLSYIPIHSTHSIKWPCYFFSPKNITLLLCQTIYGVSRMMSFMISGLWGQQNWSNFFIKRRSILVNSINVWQLFIGNTGIHKVIPQVVWLDRNDNMTIDFGMKWHQFFHSRLN